MAFQSTITGAQAYGIPGELAFEGPLRAQAAVLNSADAANNVFGRYFTLSAEGVAQAGGAGSIGGILANPKGSVSYGTTANGPLAPTSTIANGEIGELVTSGIIYVTLPGAAALGDAIKYNTTTGILGSGAPGAGEAAVPNARVSHFTVAGAGLAVITINN